MPHQPDPVVTNAKREAVIIGLAWLAATAYSCIYCYLFGYTRPDRPLEPEDIKPVLGVPAWFFWGVLAPWSVCAAFTLWFAGWYMADDDLGKDHTRELESDIREAGLHE